MIEVLVEKEWLSLSKLRIFIIDEADKMVNKKLSPSSTIVKKHGKSWQDLDAILDRLPSGAQLAAFSATYTPRTLELIERRFGQQTVHLTTEDEL